ncbi:ADP-ribosylglycohydrolase family protein [Acetobacteraceae bacterium KSS8]|uniref:ADP-ribosylglycohydrolase family protein n=1 Tax=Endosaccharibacter trunci TaxID=2812733 RepID=A0ABT1W7K3_9PROT|nr:ADP-ribosylglycohydrolase family protein [Acetobacteraceae bacterium KSS8]
MAGYPFLHSVAAVAGQLAGVIHGETGIPPEWIDRVAWGQAIWDRADRLFELQLA